MITRHLRIFSDQKRHFLASITYKMSTGQDVANSNAPVLCRWTSRVWAAVPAPIRRMDANPAGSSGEK